MRIPEPEGRVRRGGGRVPGLPTGTPRESGRVVAAFDFDGTLTRHDTFLPFLCRLCGNGAVAGALMREASLVARAVVGRAPREAVKAALLRRLLRGRPMQDVRDVAAAYAADVSARKLRRTTVDRVEWHRAQGHELVVVSASLEVYVSLVAARLRFDAVLATRLEVDEGGVLTGGLDGRNVRGAEKEHRLRQYLADRPLGWAYGDSRGDRELLAAADVAHLRGRRLAREARGRRRKRCGKRVSR